MPHLGKMGAVPWRLIVRLFKWSKMHAVFIPEIDAEHQNIFRLADELRQAVAGGAPADQAQAILRELIASAEDHFAHEERLMRSTGYPASAWHKGQHDTVRKKVKEFVPRIEGGERPGGASAARVPFRLAPGPYPPGRLHDGRPRAELRAGASSPGVVTMPGSVGDRTGRGSVPDVHRRVRRPTRARRRRRPPPRKTSRFRTCSR